MRKIIASTYMSLDGVIGNPQVWSLDHFNEEAGEYAMGLLEASDILLMGRATYDGFAGAWQNRPGNPFADKINSMRKYVVTSTLDKADWTNTTIIDGTGDVAAEVARLKEEDGGDIIIYGSGRLTDDLIRHGLLDEHHVWVHPLLVGDKEEDHM